MSVEKLTRLRSRLEELRRERQLIVDDIRERQRKLEELDGVIRRFLRVKAEGVAEQRALRTNKKK
jgi:hypothetical protein